MKKVFQNLNSKIMKWMLCMSVSWSLSAVRTASDNNVCPDLSDEMLAELRSLVVTEDVHDKMVGDFSEIWGPKQNVEEDENTCIQTSRRKLNDKELSQTIYFHGERFGGETSVHDTLEKIENGIYYLRGENGEVHGQTYVLYASNEVYGSYNCLGELETKKGEEPMNLEEKTAMQPSWSIVLIKTEDLKTPRDEEVQVAVKEAVDKIQAHEDLLGEIVEYPHPC